MNACLNRRDGHAGFGPDVADRIHIPLYEEFIVAGPPGFQLCLDLAELPRLRRRTLFRT